MRWVQITVGEPLSVTERWPTYQTSHQAARPCRCRPDANLQVALEKMISNTPLNWVVLQKT